MEASENKTYELPKELAKLSIEELLLNNSKYGVHAEFGDGKLKMEIELKEKEQKKVYRRNGESFIEELKRRGVEALAAKHTI